MYPLCAATFETPTGVQMYILFWFPPTRFSKISLGLPLTPCNSASWGPYLCLLNPCP